MKKLYGRFLSATVAACMTFVMSALFFTSSADLNGEYVEDGIEYYITNTSSPKKCCS